MGVLACSFAQAVSLKDKQPQGALIPKVKLYLDEGLMNVHPIEPEIGNLFNTT